jgi:hypothetical protein
MDQIEHMLMIEMDAGEYNAGLGFMRLNLRSTGRDHPVNNRYRIRAFGLTESYSQHGVTFRRPLQPERFDRADRYEAGAVAPDLQGIDPKEQTAAQPSLTSEKI